MEPAAIFEQLKQLVKKAKRSPQAILELRNLYPVATIWFYALDPKTKDYAQYEKILQEARNRLDYASGIPLTSQLSTWLGKEIPYLLRKYRWPIFFSFLIFISSIVFSFIASLLYPQLNLAFLGAQNYYHYLDQVRQGIKFQNFFLPVSELPLVGVVVFLNNLQVALLTAASGVFWGIGTLYILLKNGFMVGSLSALYFQSAHFIDFISQILQHGVLELTAIALAGGIGFSIAAVFYFPGRYSRMSLLRWRARETSRLFLLVFFMLALAALIEGFVTPLHLPLYLRWIVVFCSLLTIAILSYLVFKRKAGKKRET